MPRDGESVHQKRFGRYSSTLRRCNPSPNTRTLPKIHADAVKDRRSILALIAGGLAVSTAVVAGVAAAKAAESDETDLGDRYLEVAKLLGKLEVERRWSSKQLWGSNPAEGATRVTMVLDGEEYVQFMLVILVGLWAGGYRTEEQIYAMFSPDVLARAGVVS